ATDHRLVVVAESNSNARQEQARSGSRSAIKRLTSLPAGNDLPCVWVEKVDSGVVLPRYGKKLPAQAVSQRHPATNLPMVARVKPVLFPPHRVRIAELIHLARRSRQAKQEVRPTMKLRALCHAAGVTLLPRRVAAEAEGAAHRLECSALRLE